MRILRISGVSALALSVAMAGGVAAQVQTQPTAIDGSANVETELEEIVIRGQRRPPWRELRLAIERAQEVLFARFNEINSTDDFDIHCRLEKFYGFLYRFCMSNSWRGLSGKIGSEQAAVMLGRGNPGKWLVYRKEQLRMQQLLIAEMQRLTAEDEQLKQASADLSEAQYAQLLRRGIETVSRQAPPALELPYDAKLMFEVIMGNNPWNHPLTESTFTIATVFGEIRNLRIECAEGRQRIDYEIGVDWTVPNDWTSCVLQVRAKRKTTFRLLEF